MGTPYGVQPDNGSGIVQFLVDLGVDVIHPETTARRAAAMVSGTAVPPQYAGLGRGRNATLVSPVPPGPGGYAAQQRTYVAHDVGVRYSGGNFSDIANPGVMAAHTALARDNQNLGIQLLFANLVMGGKVVQGVNATFGTSIAVGGAPIPMPTPTPARELVVSSEGLVAFPGKAGPAVQGGGAAVVRPSVPTGPASPPPALLRTTDYNDLFPSGLTTKGPANPTALPTGPVAPIAAPAAGSAGKDEVL